MSNQVYNVYDTKSPEELAKLYDDWATSYDSDLEGMGGPSEAVTMMKRYVPVEARILDAGCGTGVVGHLLHEQGYQQVEGLDLSKGMLDEASRKNCYTQLHQQALGGALDFPDNHYDAIVIVGVFVRGHVSSSAFNDLIRITRPGGHIFFTLRPEFYAATDFKPNMEALEKAGLWQLAEVSEPFSGRFKAHPEVNLQTWAYRVN